ncbi:hypothetical protein BS78_02G162000 [Paspalum vaginatum]|nr:hypothetical protein BS78_02G162000 [Paspalum vaginatum]
MIHLDHEQPPPQVRPPVTDGLDQPDELPFVSRQALVPSRHGPTEEGQGSCILVEHGATAHARCVAFNNERLGEVRHGEDWDRGKSSLEVLECRRGCLRPLEDVLLEQLRQGSCNSAKVADIPAVIACQAQEPP